MRRFALGRAVGPAPIPEARWRSVREDRNIVDDGIILVQRSGDR